MRWTTWLGSAVVLGSAALSATLLWQRADTAERRARLAAIRVLPEREAIFATPDFAEAAPDAPLAIDALVDAMRVVDRLVRAAPAEGYDDDWEQGEMSELIEPTPQEEEWRVPERAPLVDLRGRVIDVTPMSPADPDLDRAIVRLGRCVDRATAAGARDPRLVAARRQLARARLCGTRPNVGRLRIRVGDPIVSRTVDEPLDVLFHPLPFGGDDAGDVARIVDGEPRETPVAVTRIERPDTAFALPPAGAYLLEARSVDNGWRRLRRVVVSGLELVVQLFPESAVVLACIDGHPRPGVAIALADEVVGVTGHDGTLALRVRPGSSSLRFDASCRDDGGVHVASITTPRAYGRWLPDGTDGRPHDDFSAHLWIDRGAYRPGETVHGRVVVRRHRETAGETALGVGAALPTTSPATGRVRLDFEFTGQSPVVCDVPLDAMGVAPFTLRVPTTVGTGGVRVSASLADRGGSVPLAIAPREFDIAAYVRPNLLLDVDWPAAADGTIAIRAALPSGVPAAGFDAKVSFDFGERPIARTCRLDAQGRASVPMPGTVPVEYASVSIRATNGIRAIESRRYRRVQSERSRTRDRRSLGIVAPERVVVGGAFEATVHGDANERVLLTVAREAPFASRVVTLGRSGRATVRFEVDASWWPHASLVAEGLADRRRAVERVDVDDPAHRLVVRPVAMADHHEPGDEVEWTVEVRDAAGAPARASVAVRVLDESFLDAVADPLVPADRSLRPTWRDVEERGARTAAFEAAHLAIDELLVDGRIPPASAVRWHPWAGWFGGRYGGRRGRRHGGEGGYHVRKDFRPLAHFEPGVVTDENGRATIRFRLPDDITRWRVTFIAVDASTGVGTHECTVRTARPVAAEAVMPRLLRVGDELDVPCRVDRSAFVDDEATLRIAADGAVVAVDQRCAVPSTARSTTRAVRIAAEAVGEATLALDVTAEDGTRLDAMRRTLPVLPETITRTARTSATFVGGGRAALPPGDGPVTIAIDDSLDQVLARAAAYVSGYPHGCAEQTCASLTPTVLALAASRARGARGPRGGLSVAQRDRLDHGMRRLATMQASDGGFLWWPDPDRRWDRGRFSRRCSDARMTAIVWSFLARLKELGVDPGDWGIEVHRSAPARGHANDGEGAAAVEFRIGDLALHPDVAEARGAAIEAADRANTLPVATIARLGRALAKAGERFTATALLDRAVARVGALRDRDGGSPVDGALTAVAATLELALDVRPDDHALHARLTTRLLGGFRNGRFAHTAGTAAALFALAGVRSREPSGAPSVVRVRSDADGAAPVDVEPGAGSTPIDVAGATELVVAGPTGRMLFVTVSRESVADGATAEPVSGAWRLERRVTRIRRGGQTIVVPPGTTPTLRVGDLFDVQFALRCPGGARYALIDCPVPANCEAIPCGSNDDDGRMHCVVDDDRAKMPLECVEGDRTQRTVRMLAVWSGRASFPPAHAFAMYGEDPGAWSGGASIVVEPAAPRD